MAPVETTPSLASVEWLSYLEPIMPLDPDLLKLLAFTIVLVAIALLRRRASRQPKPAAPPDFLQQHPEFIHRYTEEIFGRISQRVFPDLDPATLRTLFKTFRFEFSERGGFIYTPPQGTVARLVPKLFPQARTDDVLRALGKYREDTPDDTELMHVTILRVADGNPDAIAPLVKAARRDFRDVVLPVPDSGDRALRQFVMWLLEHDALAPRR